MSAGIRLDELYLKKGDEWRELLPPCGRKHWPEGYGPALAKNASAINFYADTENGSDDNDGLTLKTAVKTFEQARRVMTRYAGTKVLNLAPGTYEASVAGGQWHIYPNSGLVLLKGTDSANYPIITATPNILLDGCSALEFRNINFL